MLTLAPAKLWFHIIMLGTEIVASLRGLWKSRQEGFGGRGWYLVQNHSLLWRPGLPHLLFFLDDALDQMVDLHYWLETTHLVLPADKSFQSRSRVKYNVFAPRTVLPPNGPVLQGKWKKVKVKLLSHVRPRHHGLVYGILQARILEWVAFPFFRTSSPHRDTNPGLPHCRQSLYQLSHKGSPFFREGKY